MRRRWCRVDCLSNVLLMKTTWRRHVSMRAVWILASMSAYPYSLSVPIAYSQQLDRVIERWEMIVLRFCTQICGTRVKTRWKVLWESTYPRESNRRVFLPLLPHPSIDRNETQTWSSLFHKGDAEFAGVENAGVKIAGKGKLWKANILTICCWMGCTLIANARVWWTERNDRHCPSKDRRMTNSPRTI